MSLDTIAVNLLPSTEKLSFTGTARRYRHALPTITLPFAGYLSVVNAQIYDGSSTIPTAKLTCTIGQISQVIYALPSLGALQMNVPFPLPEGASVTISPLVKESGYFILYPL